MPFIATIRQRYFCSPNARIQYPVEFDNVLFSNHLQMYNVYICRLKENESTRN